MLPALIQRVLIVLNPGTRSTLLPRPSTTFCNFSNAVVTIFTPVVRVSVRGAVAPVRTPTGAPPRSLHGRGRFFRNSQGQTPAGGRFTGGACPLPAARSGTTLGPSPLSPTRRPYRPRGPSPERVPCPPLPPPPPRT